MRIIDLHTDFILGQAKLDKIFGVYTASQINAKKLEKSGISTILAGFSYDDELGKTELMFSETENFIANNKYKFKVLPHIEGSEIFADNPKLLESYIERGLKSVGLAHTKDNSLCGSSSSDKNLGLSAKGRFVIQKAVKNGLLVDLAHMSNNSLRETIKIIGKPPVISHTACFGIEPNSRNTKDSQIKLVSKLGGVIGIFFSGKYINSKKPPTTEDVANHVDHLVNVGGIEVVGIGSDFGGITTGTPKGLEDVTKLKNLFKVLSKRGYKKEDLEQIAYKNAERVLNLYLK